MTSGELAELRVLILRALRVRQRMRYKAGCEGKHGFPTAGMAHASKKHSDMKVFRCRYCGHWHVATAYRNQRLSEGRKRNLARNTQDQ